MDKPESDSAQLSVVRCAADPRALRARSFQSPVEVPGVSNVDFLRLAGNARRRALGKPELDPLEFYGELVPKLAALKMDHKFLERDVNTGFSGGEKKRNEILQLAVLEARARGAPGGMHTSWLGTRSLGREMPPLCGCKNLGPRKLA